MEDTQPFCQISNVFTMASKSFFDGTVPPLTNNSNIRVDAANPLPSGSSRPCVICNALCENNSYAEHLESHFLKCRVCERRFGFDSRESFSSHVSSHAMQLALSLSDASMFPIQISDFSPMFHQSTVPFEAQPAFEVVESQNIPQNETYAETNDSDEASSISNIREEASTVLLKTEEVHMSFTEVEECEPSHRVCQACGRKFNREKLLIKHLQEHVTGKLKKNGEESKKRGRKNIKGTKENLTGSRPTTRENSSAADVNKKNDTFVRKLRKRQEQPNGGSSTGLKNDATLDNRTCTIVGPIRTEESGLASSERKEACDNEESFSDGRKKRREMTAKVPISKPPQDQRTNAVPVESMPAASSSQKKACDNGENVADGDKERRELAVNVSIGIANKHPDISADFLPAIQSRMIEENSSSENENFPAQTSQTKKIGLKTPASPERRKAAGGFCRKMRVKMMRRVLVTKMRMRRIPRPWNVTPSPLLPGDDGVTPNNQHDDIAQSTMPDGPKQRKVANVKDVSGREKNQSQMTEKEVMKERMCTPNVADVQQSDDDDVTLDIRLRRNTSKNREIAEGPETAGRSAVRGEDPAMGLITVDNNVNLSINGSSTESACRQNLCESVPSLLPDNNQTESMTIDKDAPGSKSDDSGGTKNSRIDSIQSVGSSVACKATTGKSVELEKRGGGSKYFLRNNKNRYYLRDSCVNGSEVKTVNIKRKDERIKDISEGADFVAVSSGPAVKERSERHKESVVAGLPAGDNGTVYHPGWTIDDDVTLDELRQERDRSTCLLGRGFEKKLPSERIQGQKMLGKAVKKDQSTASSSKEDFFAMKKRKMAEKAKKAEMSRERRKRRSDDNNGAEANRKKWEGKARPNPLGGLACQKTFETTPKLQKHLKIHSRKNYFCAACQVGFKNERQLTWHRTTYDHMTFIKFLRQSAIN